MTPNARFHKGPRAHGFTLVELIVVIMIIGLLVAFAVPAYLKSVETSKADDAAAVMNMVGTTNRMFYLDHGNTYASGTLTTTDPLCQAGAACPAGPGYTACALVACKYLAAQDWSAKPYDIAASNAVGSCLGLGAGNLVACVKRKTAGSTGTSLAPYNGWGYTLDATGVMTPVGGAPTPVQ